MLEDYETRMKELRALVDEGDAAIAAGKVHTYAGPEEVAYPRPADNVSRPLVFRLRRVTQPVVSTRSVFSPFF